jgi:hypothetical protein
LRLRAPAPARPGRRRQHGRQPCRSAEFVWVRVCLVFMFPWLPRPGSPRAAGQPVCDGRARVGVMHDAAPCPGEKIKQKSQTATPHSHASAPVPGRPWPSVQTWPPRLATGAGVEGGAVRGACARHSQWHQSARRAVRLQRTAPQRHLFGATPRDWTDVTPPWTLLQPARRVDDRPVVAA